MTRFVLALTLLAACGPIAPQTPAASNTKVAKGKKVHCKQVTTTGSMMTRSMCTTEQDDDETREASQRALREPKGGPRPPAD